MKEKFRKAVFIVVYRGRKDRINYLILRRKLHWRGWEFPKGGKKFLESDKRAVEREVHEETGQIPFNIKNFKIAGRYRYPKKLADREDFAGQTYKLYSAQIKDKNIKIDRLEHSEYRWVDFKGAMNKIKYNNQRKCLKIVDDFLRKK